MTNAPTPAEKALEQLALTEDFDGAEVEGFAVYLKIDTIPGEVESPKVDLPNQPASRFNPMSLKLDRPLPHLKR